ncbi:hypothetical protein DSL92_03375 [Billgrantia gudaonensis]|uniref:Uncharacterized protein n=1 Tax=Billgrantia gudaonensis TaxID=376427 RepID=A0A3S0QS11_9GAMM|nr:hypothetical protein DSL92_03375 [Halomonas gudaonensis]
MALYELFHFWVGFPSGHAWRPDAPLWKRVRKGWRLHRKLPGEARGAHRPSLSSLGDQQLLG